VAVKKTELNPRNESALATEIYMLKTIAHPNIVSYVNSFFLPPQFIWVSGVVLINTFRFYTKFIHFASSSFLGKLFDGLSSADSTGVHGRWSFEFHHRFP
jgi:hypothetical protein